MTPLHIRPLQQDDFFAWKPLWNANNLGQENEAVTSETWKRLTSQSSQVHGLCALDGNEMVGLVHYILHPTTGSIEPVCYMQDLFVSKDHRRKGIAKQLVLALAKIGQDENWSRMYWLAETKNKAAQTLYKTIGIKLDFSLHVLPIGAI